MAGGHVGSLGPLGATTGVALRFGFAFLTTRHLGGDREAVVERGAVRVLGFAEEIFDY